MQQNPSQILKIFTVEPRDVGCQRRDPYCKLERLSTAEVHFILNWPIKAIKFKLISQKLSMTSFCERYMRLSYLLSAMTIFATFYVDRIHIYSTLLKLAKGWCIEQVVKTTSPRNNDDLLNISPQGGATLKVIFNFYHNWLLSLQNITLIFFKSKLV